LEWLTRLSGAIVGLDSAPLIYYIEESPQYIAVVQPFFDALDRSAFQAITSTVTLLEVLVHPLRRRDQKLAEQYCDILTNSPGLRTIPVYEDIAQIAAQIRARYPIRTPDAIQLATSIHQGASFFLTNDRRLPAIPQLAIVVLDDLR